MHPFPTMGILTHPPTQVHTGWWWLWWSHTHLSSSFMIVKTKKNTIQMSQSASARIYIFMGFTHAFACLCVDHWCVLHFFVFSEPGCYFSLQDDKISWSCLIRFHFTGSLNFIPAGIIWGKQFTPTPIPLVPLSSNLLHWVQRSTSSGFIVWVLDYNALHYTTCVSTA